MSAIFQPGDVVGLKSGGPRMTVLSVLGNMVTVTWVDTQNRHVVDFPNFALVKFHIPVPDFEDA